MADNNSVDLKKLLKKREKHYLETTQEILEIFLPQFSEAIKEVIYDGNSISILVKGIYPLVNNLNYVAIVAKVGTMAVGDVIPVIYDEGDTPRNIKITKENYWNLADTITLNIPISILETQDVGIITEFIREVCTNDIEVPTNESRSEESLFNIGQDKNKFDDSTLDTVQQKLLGLYNQNEGSKH